MHKLIASILFCIAANTYGQTFSMEESLPHPIAIPPQALAIISKEYGSDFQNYGCLGNLSQNLEAAKIDLGKGHNTALVVKPNGMCLCGASSCVFWLFMRNRNKQNLIAKIYSHNFTINKQKSANGLFVLSTWSGTAGHTTEEEHYFNGRTYQVAKSKTWQAH